MFAEITVAALGRATSHENLQVLEPTEPEEGSNVTSSFYKRETEVPRRDGTWPGSGPWPLAYPASFQVGLPLQEGASADQHFKEGDSKERLCSGANAWSDVHSLEPGQFQPMQRGSV